MNIIYTLSRSVWLHISQFWYAECAPYDIKRKSVWLCMSEGTWSQVLSLRPHFLRVWTPRVVTLEYSGACEALQSPVRMSPPALGSFDKQSIYWYMIKYARNHPTAKGYYSFNIIIWINKHSAQE